MPGGSSSENSYPSAQGPLLSPLLLGFFFCGSVQAFELLELAHHALVDAARLPVAPGIPDALIDRARIDGPTDQRSREFLRGHHPDHLVVGNGPARRGGRGVRVGGHGGGRVVTVMPDRKRGRPSSSIVKVTTSVGHRSRAMRSADLLIGRSAGHTVPSCAWAGEAHSARAASRAGRLMKR